MADFIESDAPEDEEHVIYWAPVIMCKNRRNRLGHYWDEERHHDICKQIPLPFPNLPKESEDQFDWPDDEWKRTIVCIECGHVYEYVADDVSWAPVRRLSQARFRNETNCFSVKLKCAQKGCEIPVEFHIEIFGKRERDLRDAIKKGFVGEWPSCGHPAMAAPHSDYSILRVYEGPI